MSEDTERIRACLTRDWKTTVQILEESGIRCTNRRCGLVKVYNTLDSDRKYGLVVLILTPRECWRLMGFPEWAYLRASRVSSETQLYNQAGNSIVVEVLIAIFNAMFRPQKYRIQKRLFEVEV